MNKNRRSRMGYNAAGVLWQIEEVPMSLKEKMTTKMLKIIFTTRCLPIHMIRIKFILRDFISACMRLALWMNVLIQKKWQVSVENIVGFISALENLM